MTNRMMWKRVNGWSIEIFYLYMCCTGLRNHCSLFPDGWNCWSSHLWTTLVSVDVFLSFFLFLSLSLFRYSPLLQSSLNYGTKLFSPKNKHIYKIYQKLSKSRNQHKTDIKLVWDKCQKCDDHTIKCSQFSRVSLTGTKTHRPTQNCGEEQNGNNGHFHCITVWDLDRGKTRNLQVVITQ